MDLVGIYLALITLFFLHNITLICFDQTYVAQGKLSSMTQASSGISGISWEGDMPS